jgi:5-bromo-4-chloroindolyl phosphate hydrolysis protein
MLLYLLLTLSVIVLILSLCRENEKYEENYRENFSSKSTSESVYNGVEDTNKKCNEIRKKLDETNEKLMKFYDEVERLRMKKQIAKDVV